MAVRLARAFTGKRHVAKFAGHFHGWHEGLEIGVRPPYEAEPEAGQTPGGGSGEGRGGEEGRTWGGAGYLKKKKKKTVGWANAEEIREVRSVWLQGIGEGGGCVGAGYRMGGGRAWFDVGGVSLRGGLPGLWER